MAGQRRFPGRVDVAAHATVYGLRTRREGLVEEPIDLEELRSRVAEHRRALGLSLRAAADDSGVPLNTLSRVERGHLPDLANFSRLVTWLGQEPTQFFRGHGRLHVDNTIEAIRATLRQDRNLTPQAAAQIAEIVSKLYSTLATTPAGNAEIHLRAQTTFTPDAARQLGAILEKIQQILDVDDRLGVTPGWNE